MNQKRITDFSVILNGESGGHKNIGRELVFSADLWYNGFSKSLLPRGRWHGVAVTEGDCVTLDLY